MITVKDIDRLVTETQEHISYEYTEENGLNRWATDHDISAEALNYVLTNVAMLMLDDVKVVFERLINGEKADPAMVMDLIQDLRSGVAVSLITGLELQRQLLSPKTDPREG